MKKFSKSQLAITLSKMEVFRLPDMVLEQYPTDSEIAAEVLWNAAMLGDLKEASITDLGCGGGQLGIGCLLLGAARAELVDIDPTALEIAKKNLSKIESLGVLVKNGKGEADHPEAVLILQDVAVYKGKADVVIMNPPFGTRVKHADRDFLTKAMEAAPIIYSFHKSETLPYLKGFLAKNSYAITHHWDFAFPLKGTMAHHRRKIHRIAVSCIRLAKQQGI